MMDIELFLKLANFVLVVGVGLYSWVMSRDKATAVEIKELNGEVARLQSRVNMLESELTHVPNKESVHRLEIAITKLSGDLSSQTEMFKSAVHAVRRVEEYLLSSPLIETAPAPAPARSRTRKKAAA